MTNAMTQLRPKCLLIGCDPDTLPRCKRCGTDLYDPEFIQRGLLEPYFYLRWKLWSWRRSSPLLPKNCQVCGMRYFRGAPDGMSKYVCSDHCAELWIPF